MTQAKAPFIFHTGWLGATSNSWSPLLGCIFLFCQGWNHNVCHLHSQHRRWWSWPVFEGKEEALGANPVQPLDGNNVLIFFDKTYHTFVNQLTLEQFAGTWILSFPAAWVLWSCVATLNVLWSDDARTCLHNTPAHRHLCLVVNRKHNSCARSEAIRTLEWKWNQVSKTIQSLTGSECIHCTIQHSHVSCCQADVMLPKDLHNFKHVSVKRLEMEAASQKHSPRLLVEMKVIAARVHNGRWCGTKGGLEANTFCPNELPRACAANRTVFMSQTGPERVLMCILLFASLLTFSKFVFPTHFLTLLALGTLSGSSRGIPQTWWYLSARTCIIICSPTLVECPRSQRATTFWSPQLFKTIPEWFGDSTSCFLRYVDSRIERLVVSLGFRGAPDWLIQVAKAQLVVFNDQNTNWWLNWFKACPVAKFVGIVPEMKTTQTAKITRK